MGSPAMRFSGEAVLELIDGVVPVSGDGEGEVDDVQQRTVSSNP
jgi:hypothetical protein